MMTGAYSLMTWPKMVPWSSLWSTITHGTILSHCLSDLVISGDLLWWCEMTGAYSLMIHLKWSHEMLWSTITHGTILSHCPRLGNQWGLTLMMWDGRGILFNDWPKMVPWNVMEYYYSWDHFKSLSETFLSVGTYSDDVRWQGHTL